MIDAATRRKLVALCELAVVALLLRAHAEFFDVNRIGEMMLTFNYDGLFGLDMGEARLLAVNALVALPAILLLADASLRLLPESTWFARLTASPRRTAICCAIFAALLCELLARYFGHAVFTDDEHIYQWSARNLLHGSFTAPHPEPAAFFQKEFRFMLTAANGRGASMYPPGVPALIALGMLLHAPHLPQVICVGLIVYVAARLADDFWGAEAQVATALLAALSPFLLLVGASWHNTIPTTLFCLLAFRSSLAVYRHGRVRDALFAGLALGAALVCRPVDATCFAVPCGLLFLVPLVRGNARARRIAGLAIATAAGLPFLFVLLSWNRAVTGQWLRSPVELYASQMPGTHLFGFGPSPFWLQHTVGVAFTKMLVTWVRVESWLLGWPMALGALALLVLLIQRSRAALLLLGVIGVHTLVYFFYTAGSVQTFGSYYQMPLLPALVAMTAFALLALRDRLRPLGAHAAKFPGRVALAATLIGIFTFWMPEVGFIGRTADTINGPLFAADEAAKDGPILVFYKFVQPPRMARSSWVFYPPQTNSDPNERVLWASDLGPQNAELIKLHPERRPMRFEWDRTGTPRVTPYVAK